MQNYDHITHLFVPAHVQRNRKYSPVVTISTRMLVSFTYASLLVRVRGALAAVDMVNSTQVLPTVEPVSAL